MLCGCQVWRGEKKAIPPRSGNQLLFVPAGKRQRQCSPDLAMLSQPHTMLTGTSAFCGWYREVFYVCRHVVGISTDIYLSSLSLLDCDSCSVLIKQHMTNALLLTAAGEVVNLAAA